MRDPAGPGLLRPSPALDGASEQAADQQPAVDEQAAAPDPTTGSLRDRLRDLEPARSVWGWLGPFLVAALAGVLRLVDLGRPRELVFDETYYVKQAYSLLRLGYEARWGEGADERFAAADFSPLGTIAEYYVHPPLGKWLIAAGLHVLGPESSAGWRLASAVAGTLTVLLLARLARRLFASTLLGCLAGFFLAVDGLHLVESRTGLLDVFLGLFTVAAFGAVVLDRRQVRRRLADRLAADDAGADPGAPVHPWGPPLGPRWWLLAAGLLCGLATGVKWSGIYVLAALGLLTVTWDVAARRAAGTRLWLGAGLLRDGVPAFLTLVPAAALAYLVTWIRWFATPQAYLRQWADQHPEGARRWLPDALESLLEFHRAVWDFHHGLSSPHAYEAGPLGWLVQWRPTSFFWGDVAEQDVACGAARCVQAITSAGNPIVWWGGAPALVVVVVLAVRARDWRAWTIVTGYAALWLPWFLYPARTTFTFYAGPLAAFVALALTYALALLLGWRPGNRLPPLGRDRENTGIVLAVVVLAAAAAAFFWPVWTAAVIPFEQWQLRMWLPSWV